MFAATPIKKSWFSARSVGILAVAIVGVSLLAVVAVAARRQAVLMQTASNLKWVGIALHQYHDQYGSFPPPVVYGQDRVAWYSWRALIQPYLTPPNEPGEKFPDYEFSKPWDQQPSSQSELLKRYDNQPYQFLAVVGANAAWATDHGRSLSEIKDGTSDTILLIAIRKTGIKWHQPVDASIKDGRLFLGDRQLDLSADVFMLTADGGTMYFANGIDDGRLGSMLTIAAGDTVPDWSRE